MSIPLSAYLGAVGMPGVTAWYGLTQICLPKEGETVAESLASAPEAFLGLLKGRNFGKQVVKLV